MSDPSGPRKAPPAYERIIPVILLLLVVLIVILGVITLAVVMGLWPG